MVTEHLFYLNLHSVIAHFCDNRLVWYDILAAKAWRGASLLNIIFNRAIISSPNNIIIDSLLPLGGVTKTYIQYAVHINRANDIAFIKNML